MVGILVFVFYAWSDPLSRQRLVTEPRWCHAAWKFSVYAPHTRRQCSEHCIILSIFFTISSDGREREYVYRSIQQHVKLRSFFSCWEADWLKTMCVYQRTCYGQKIFNWFSIEIDIYMLRCELKFRLQNLSDTFFSLYHIEVLCNLTILNLSVACL